MAGVCAMTLTRVVRVVLVVALIAAVMGPVGAQERGSFAALGNNSVIAIGDPGGDPVSTSITLSQSTFESADSVVIAREDVFADSLSSGALQGRSRPLLLTNGQRLSPAVAAEIGRLQAGEAIVLGGEAAVSTGVAGELSSLGLSVQRAAGPNRIETAVAVASAFFPAPGGAILARAFGDSADETRAFVDSMAVGGLAADLGIPILLTDSRTLGSSVQNYLAGLGGPL